MTERATLQIRQQNAVRWIVIDRPEKLNALNQEVIEALDEAFGEAAADPQCRVVVLTGAGDRAFVAGADIAELQALEPGEAEAFVRRGHELMDRIEGLGKPVLAAINGFALGGGCELALACTLRFAADSARIGLPEVKLGLLPGYGGTQRLARLVGRGRALEMMLGGEPVTAARALEWGLVNGTAPAEELHALVSGWAEKLASGAPLAMEGILSAVHEGVDLPMADGLEVERERFARICSSEDMREGTAAFLEKRAASFRGR